MNSLKGTTRNPYALDRVPAGSSGGTAAAVAANFGLVGLGSDTGNSIRGPSAHTALVGIRSTMGLTSRSGVIPLSYLADVAGPMTRTVTDAARVFGVIVGEDPSDAMTARSRGRATVDYVRGLSATALRARDLACSAKPTNARTHRSIRTSSPCSIAPSRTCVRPAPR